MGDMTVTIRTRMFEDMCDRIEELEAKLAKATEKIERLGREVNVARYGQPDFAWSVHKAAMADLEAKLAKAGEVKKAQQLFNHCAVEVLTHGATVDRLKALDAAWVNLQTQSELQGEK